MMALRCIRARVALARRPLRSLARTAHPQPAAAARPGALARDAHDARTPLAVALARSAGREGATPSRLTPTGLGAPLARSAGREGATPSRLTPTGRGAPLFFVAPARWLGGALLGARRRLSTGVADLYARLGVDRRATTDEIKRAYYREAKLSHPDVNSTKEAAVRFRQVAEAYEVLRDPTRRRLYDLGGFARAAGQTQTSQGGGWDGNVDPRDVFRSVWKDFGLDDIQLYFERISQEGTRAFEAATDGRRDFEPGKRFLVAHKGLIISTVLPLLLVLRHPAAAFAVARGGLVLVLAAVRFMPAPLRYQLLSGLWASAIAYLNSRGGASRGPPPPPPPRSGSGAR